MARAYGSDAVLLGRFEDDYGDFPADEFIKFPFTSYELGSEQGLIEDDTLGQGRDPLSPSQDVINVDGNIVVPVDLRFIGYFLRGLFGDPATTDNGDGTYDHVFVSGKSVIPSMAFEVGHPRVPVFFRHAGTVLESIALNFERSGNATATIAAVAQGEESAAVTVDADPIDDSVIAFRRFSQFQGAILKDSTPLANVTAAALTYSNNLERITTIRSDGKIDGADQTVASLSGNIDVRFADTQLTDLAAAGTPVELSFEYTISPFEFLKFTAHKVHLPKAKLPVSGPGGVQASFNFQGAKDAAEGQMLTIMLRNDIASYTS